MVNAATHSLLACDATICTNTSKVGHTVSFTSMDMGRKKNKRGQKRYLEKFNCVIQHSSKHCTGRHLTFSSDPSVNTQLQTFEIQNNVCFNLSLTKPEF